MNADIADRFAPGAWEFTPAVVEEFDGHVRASVPFYDVIQDAVAELSDWLAPYEAVIADLGASTGTTMDRILTRHPDRALFFDLYDESRHMLDAAKTRFADLPVDVARYACHPGRIEAAPMHHQPAALTVALFTLQFLDPPARRKVLAEAHRCSAVDGAILVAEKVRVADSRWAEIATEVSWDVKADAGIPAESIRSKARALRGVLRPVREATLTAELETAGWVAPTVLFRWHQWALFGAFASAR